MPGGHAPKVEERSQITRFLLTDGEMGALPDWFRTIKAAQAIGVPPWELADKPLIWQEWALSAQAAENAAKEERERHAARKSKSKGKK